MRSQEGDHPAILFIDELHLITVGKSPGGQSSGMFVMFSVLIAGAYILTTSSRVGMPRIFLSPHLLEVNSDASVQLHLRSIESTSRRMVLWSVDSPRSVFKSLNICDDTN